MELSETEGRIEAALERSREFAGFPRIVEVRYHSEPGLEYLGLRLDDGHRLLIPREELSELARASDEQACDVIILPQGRAVWWPQLDDGLYLPDFLEFRWGKALRVERRWQLRRRR